MNICFRHTLIGPAAFPRRHHDGGRRHLPSWFRSGLPCPAPLSALPEGFAFEALLPIAWPVKSPATIAQLWPHQLALVAGRDRRRPGPSAAGPWPLHLLPPPWPGLADPQLPLLVPAGPHQPELVAGLVAGRERRRPGPSAVGPWPQHLPPPWPESADLPRPARPACAPGPASDFVAGRC